MPTTEGPAAAAAVSPLVAHHFDDADQQQRANLLGMWIFLATEVMFFGGMFAAYTIYRHALPEAFAAASRRLDLLLGTINTAVLLTSSLTMALAVDAARRDRRNLLLGFLAGTLFLGSIFLAIKFTEYYHKYQEHHLPLTGLPFEISGPLAGQEQLFFGFYVAMTGFHALHLLIGIGLIGWLTIGAWQGGLLAERSQPVEICGLYWHFVDIVWIFLFPLLYLVDRS